MSVKSYEIRLCQNPACGLRYPLTENQPFGKTQGRPFGKRCPACLGETQVALRNVFPPHSQPLSPPVDRVALAALLDNLRSAWNVGAIFRTADGLGVSKLYLCGITPTPENKAVTKTSLGAEESVGWEYSRNALEKAKKLKREGLMLIALEQDSRAVSLTEFNPSPPASGGSTHVQGGGLILILGNEITGVDPEILDICDHIVHIPMRGRKNSFNVEVTFAIAAYYLANNLAKDVKMH